RCRRAFDRSLRARGFIGRTGDPHKNNEYFQGHHWRLQCAVRSRSEEARLTAPCAVRCVNPMRWCGWQPARWSRFSLQMERIQKGPNHTHPNERGSHVNPERKVAIFLPTAFAETMKDALAGIVRGPQDPAERTSGHQRQSHHDRVLPPRRWRKLELPDD